MERALDSLLRQYESGGISRRDLIVSLALLVASTAVASDSNSIYRATELNHVTIRVSDLKRSKEFYQHLLGLAVTKEDKHVCRLSSGRGAVALWQADAAPGFDHFCFGVPGFQRSAGMAKLSGLGMALRHDKDDPETVYVLDPDNLTVQLEPEGFK